MFKNKVVYILGAGASKEVNFPVGDELKRDLGALLDIRFKDGFEQISGDRQITEALRLHAQSLGTRDINPWRQAGVMIHAAMTQALSIDNYLQAHSDNEKAVLCGKLGIARRMLEAEQNSPLYENEVRQIPVNFDVLEKTWYARFFQLLTANSSRHDVATIFNNMSIISFNYDRSLEHYLTHALANYYSLPIAEAQQVVRSLEILHPYGTVGKLPWQSSDRSVPYGGSGSPEELLRAASQLQTFAEQLRDEILVGRIQSVLQEAKSIIFLGFAFHEINMKVLTLGCERAPRAIYATAYGISPEDCSVIQEEAYRSLRSNSEHVAIRHELKCKNLFDQYWRTFSAM